MADDTRGGPQAGATTLLQSLRTALRDVLELLHVRLELLGVEAREHALTAVELLVFGLAAVVFLGLGLAFLAGLLTVLLWDSHRSLALALCTAVFLTLGGVALFMARRRARDSQRWFDASLRELSRDAERVGPP